MNLTEGHLLLQRRHCEERRQFVAELERLATRLCNDGMRLAAEFEQTLTLGHWASANALSQRQGTIERSLTAIESQIGAANAALVAAEQELRQHEHAFAQRAAGLALAARRREMRQRRRGRKPSPAPLDANRR